MKCSLAKRHLLAIAVMTLVLICFSLPGKTRQEKYVTNIQITIAMKRPDYIQLFYTQKSGKEQDFAENQSVIKSYKTGNEFQRIEFDLETFAEIDLLRFDFGNVLGNEVRLKRIRVQRGDRIKDWSPLEIAQQFRLSMLRIDKKDSTELKFTTIGEEGRSDPFIFLKKNYRLPMIDPNQIIKITLHFKMAQPDVIQLFYLKQNKQGIDNYVEHWSVVKGMLNTQEYQEMQFELKDADSLTHIRFDFGSMALDLLFFQYQLQAVLSEL